MDLLLEHDLWLQKARVSTRAEIKELLRIHDQARLTPDEWLLVWWLGTLTLDDPSYRTSAREIYFRIKGRTAAKEVKRLLSSGWRDQTGVNDTSGRRLVLNTRRKLKAFNEGPHRHGVRIELPKNPVSLDGSFTIEFVDLLGDDAPVNLVPDVQLRPSAQIWKRLLRPIGSSRGMLIYSNEQPEQGAKMSQSGLYSGTGEVAAALLIGLRTAHLNCEISPYRSRRFGLDQFRQQKSWFVFLGSPASNSGLVLVRGMPKWRKLQMFAFERPTLKNVPWVLKRNDDPTFQRFYEPAANHKAATEYALITYMHVKNQVVIAFSGMTTVGTYAAVRYFADDERLEELLSLLEIGPNDSIPSFEVVIKMNVFDGQDDDQSIEAYHKHLN